MSQAASYQPSQEALYQPTNTIHQSLISNIPSISCQPDVPSQADLYQPLSSVSGQSVPSQAASYQTYDVYCGKSKMLPIASILEFKQRSCPHTVPNLQGSYLWKRRRRHQMYREFWGRISSSLSASSSSKL